MSKLARPDWPCWARRSFYDEKQRSIDTEPGDLQAPIWDVLVVRPIRTQYASNTHRIRIGRSGLNCWPGFRLRNPAKQAHQNCKTDWANFPRETCTPPGPETCAGEASRVVSCILPVRLRCSKLKAGMDTTHNRNIASEERVHARVWAKEWLQSASNATPGADTRSTPCGTPTLVNLTGPTNHHETLVKSMILMRGSMLLHVTSMPVLKALLGAGAAFRALLVKPLST